MAVEFLISQSWELLFECSHHFMIASIIISGRVAREGNNQEPFMRTFDFGNNHFDEIPVVHFDELVPQTQRNRMKVALETRGLTTLGLIQYSQEIHDHIVGNAAIPSPNPSMPTLQTAIDTAQTKLNGVEMTFDVLRMNRAERRGAYDALVAVLEALAGHVQSVSNGDEAIILSTGMSVRGPATPVGALPAPSGLVATTNGMDGEIGLAWDGMRGAGNFVVQRALDPNNGTSWIQVGLPTRSSFVGAGLTSGTKYWYRVAANGPEGLGPWCDPAFKMAT